MRCEVEQMRNDGPGDVLPSSCTCWPAASGASPHPAQPPRSRAIKYFGRFRFNEPEQTLWCGTDQIRLTRKAAALLDCLLDEPGTWRTKAAILHRVWPDVHVQPDNVKVLIREIRVALGDDSRRPRYIGSEPKRGYVFLATVTDSGCDDGVPDDIGRRATRPLFVHRGPELATLIDEFTAALAGEARTVIMTGGPGAGKSAIVQAFLRTARALHPFRLLSFTSNSSSHVDALPAFGSIGGKLNDGAATALPAPEPDLPLVFVVEDLDAADSSLVEQLASLVVNRRGGRVMVVATSSRRAVTLPPETAPAPRCIAVSKFTQLQVQRYLNVRFLPLDMSGLADAMHDLSGGNPRALSAMADVFVERGLIRQTSDGWQFVTGLDQIAGMLPDLAGRRRAG